MNKKILNVHDSNFEQEILQINKVCLVDFWAEWCGPCKMMMPILTEIADEFHDKIVVAKLNIDNNPITVLKYGIRSVPTMLLFRNGVNIDSKVGSISKNQLSDFLNTHI